jgi:hypothetical protein
MTTTLPLSWTGFDALLASPESTLLGPFMGEDLSLERWRLRIYHDGDTCEEGA